MDVTALLLQTAGSLAAILALAGLAWWLKLGVASALVGEGDIRRVAGEVEDGFDPLDCAVSKDHTAALARDADGRIMVIKRHGNRFAGRILGPRAQARLWRDRGMAAVEVDPGEPRFGTVFLDIAEADTWADAINRVDSSRHA
ncbi:MAG: hypothetical protein CVT75_13420 [Alphaproteobacteria bacterium HGW-Alphaproteobacteria-14]|nr:MAG: hypothetical protein CVT75_13420 [Alphaproteobacteria bacterium HGW-Alphaproteobacteria-14]